MKRILLWGWRVAVTLGVLAGLSRETYVFVTPPAIEAGGWIEVWSCEQPEPRELRP